MHILQCSATEQIAVRIVQIMIQSTNLAQLLYMGHSPRNKCGPHQISIWPPFSKMAAMGYPEVLFCAFKMAGSKNGQNGYFYIKLYVLIMQNVQLML